MGFLQRYHVIVARPMGEKIDGMAAERQELGMRPAVGRTDQGQDV